MDPSAPFVASDFETADYPADSACSVGLVPFDSRVLRSCCETSRLRPPEIDFVCTVALARRAWGIRPTK